MSDHLVDTTIKLGRCNRCEAYVFMAMSSGIRAAADPAPATREDYIAALTDGRRCFDLIQMAGRPQKLQTRRLRSPAPLYDAAGAQIATQGRRAVLVEHGCGGHQRNMITFTEIEQGPPPARATPGSSRSGGPRQQAAHESGLTVEEIPRSPVVPASRRRSEPRPVCGTCQRRCAPGTYWGIQHGHIWIYCEHDECE